MSSPEKPEPPVVLDHDAAAPAGHDDRLPAKANQTLEVDHLDTDALRLPILDHYGRHAPAPTQDGHGRDLFAGAGTHALPISNTYLSSDSAPMQWSLLAIRKAR